MKITVSVTGSTTVVITQMQTQFTDSTGRQAAQVTLPSFPVTLTAPGPTMQFGVPTSQLLVRTFTFNVGTGCSTGHQGMAVVTVNAIDDAGRQLTQQVRVPVR
jgi:hypothetical protein